jgi:hypothetical protein
MSYKIAFDERSEFLYARITGTNTPETIVSYLQDVVEKCTEIDCFRVLLHECLDGPRLTFMELFETISDVSKRVLGNFDAVAYVDENMGELMEFGEDVAVNRGMPLAAFDNLDDATRWLLAQKEDSGGSEIFRSTLEDS